MEEKEFEALKDVGLPVGCNGISEPSSFFEGCAIEVATAPPAVDGREAGARAKTGPP